MLRHFRKIIFGLVGIAVLAGCGGGGSTPSTTTAVPSLPVPTFAPGTTMAKIQQTGRVKVGVKFDQPGFGLQNPQSKQLEGFDIEMTKLIAQGLFGGTLADAAQKIDFIQTVSRNREPFLQQGDVDFVVANYSITDARKQVVDFAGPYYMAHGDIMVKASDPTIRSVADLNGKTVCIARNTIYEQSVRRDAPQSQQLVLDTYSQCLEALRDDRAAAVVTDNVILSGLVQANKGEFALANTSFSEEPYGIGIRKGDDAFRSFLNERLRQVEDDGQWRQAFVATLGKFDLSVPEPPSIEAPSVSSTTLPSTSVTTTTIGATTSTLG